MNICLSRVRGMVFGFAICFLGTIHCQDQKWTSGYHQASPPVWASDDLHVQGSVGRPFFSNQLGLMRWQNPRSKPHWQTSMYKVKWQDQFSKPQWQASKVHHLKPFTKRPFKNINALDKKPPNDRGIHKEWNGRSHPKAWTPMHISAPRYPSSQRPAWPEYIPPISMIKPSMDDPHALYNF